MKLTLLEILQFMTFVALLAMGIFFLACKDFIFAFLFVGVAVLYLKFKNRASSYALDKTTEFAAKIAVIWMLILMCVVLYIIDVSSNIWMLLIPVPLGLFFLWMVITGR
jgi:hypothetical protein